MHVVAMRPSRSTPAKPTEARGCGMDGLRGRRERELARTAARSKPDGASGEIGAPKEIGNSQPAATREPDAAGVAGQDRRRAVMGTRPPRPAAPRGTGVRHATCSKPTRQAALHTWHACGPSQTRGDCGAHDETWHRFRG
jgi:hypothetical protein